MLRFSDLRRRFHRTRERALRPSSAPATACPDPPAPADDAQDPRVRELLDRQRLHEVTSPLLRREVQDEIDRHLNRLHRLFIEVQPQVPVQTEPVSSSLDEDRSDLLLRQLRLLREEAAQLPDLEPEQSPLEAPTSPGPLDTPDRSDAEDGHPDSGALQSAMTEPRDASVSPEPPEPDQPLAPEPAPEPSASRLKPLRAALREPAPSVPEDRLESATPADEPADNSASIAREAAAPAPAPPAALQAPSLQAAPEALPQEFIDAVESSAAAIATSDVPSEEAEAVDAAPAEAVDHPNDDVGALEAAVLAAANEIESADSPPDASETSGEAVLSESAEAHDALAAAVTAVPELGEETPAVPADSPPPEPPPAEPEPVALPAVQQAPQAVETPPATPPPSSPAPDAAAAAAPAQTLPLESTPAPAGQTPPAAPVPTPEPPPKPAPQPQAVAVRAAGPPPPKTARPAAGEQPAATPPSVADLAKAPGPDTAPPAVGLIARLLQVFEWPLEPLPARLKVGLGVAGVVLALVSLAVIVMRFLGWN